MTWNKNLIYGGSMWDKTLEKLLHLLKRLQWRSKCRTIKGLRQWKKNNIIDMDGMTIINTNLKALTRETKKWRLMLSYLYLFVSCAKGNMLLLIALLYKRIKVWIMWKKWAIFITTLTILHRVIIQIFHGKIKVRKGN